MRLRFDFTLMELDGEIIAVPISDGASDFHGVIKLNEEAKVIFDLLQTETTKEIIVESLAKEYSTPKDDLGRMVGEFLEKLAQADLLIS